MNYTVEQHKNEITDRRKSAIITAIVSLLVLLLIIFYKFSRTPDVEPEAVTTMLINFGDNRNGSNVEEPANQDGSLAASEFLPTQDPVSEPQKQTTIPVNEKLISGNNTKVSTPKIENKAVKSQTKSTKTTKKSASSTKSSTSNNSGDGQGKNAIGNLLKGRGTNPGSQGTNGTEGNNGDPLGGDGNGDSKIGIDRKLVDFIPGTMGRGGQQPANSCSASGTITIAFTVDKAGNVVSAKRSGGISDACVAKTSVDWVKKYVKAERANTSSTGSYKITF